jgi:hypothetical protein
MTAASRTAAAAADTTTLPERAWGRTEFEALSEDEVVAVLLRRMRRLLDRGVEPGEALVLASRVDLPVA